MPENEAINIYVTVEKLIPATSVSLSITSEPQPKTTTYFIILSFYTALLLRKKPNKHKTTICPYCNFYLTWTSCERFQLWEIPSHLKVMKSCIRNRRKDKDANIADF